MRESVMLPEERPAPVIADDASAATPEAAAPVVEAKPEEPKAPEVTADPTTWPEPARVAHEQVAAKAQALEAENTKWREAGPKAVMQNRRLAEENKLLRQTIEQANLQIDPRDVDLIGFRVAQAHQEQMKQWDAQRAEAAKAQGVEAQREAGRREAVQLVNQVQTAAKAAGVDFKQVGIIVHAQMALDGKADIADAIAQVKAKQLAAHRAAATNVPAPVRSTLPASNLVKHDRSRAGKEARVAQWTS